MKKQELTALLLAVSYCSFFWRFFNMPVSSSQHQNYGGIFSFPV